MFFVSAAVFGMIEIFSTHRQHHDRICGLIMLAVIRIVVDNADRLASGKTGTKPCLLITTMLSEERKTASPVSALSRSFPGQ